MEFGERERPSFAASSLIDGEVWCDDNITPTEKIIYLQLCKYPCLLNTSLIILLHC